MEMCRVWRDGQEIARNVRIADNFIKRFKGLLFDNELQEEQGLLIVPCSQVHTIGMKFCIDVIFLSKSGEVIHTESDMIPGVIGPHIPHCDRILELKDGTIRKKRIARGQRIAFGPVKKMVGKREI